MTRLGRLLSLVGLLWLASAGSGQAATLCVCGTGGDDARSKATVAASASGTTCSLPWASIARAAWGSTTRLPFTPLQAADAGDTVYICAGTYVTAGTDGSQPSSNRFHVAYSPANSGSSGNPIKFICVGTCNLTYSSGSGPMLGVTAFWDNASKHYIEWLGDGSGEGFKVDHATAPMFCDSGAVVIHANDGFEIQGARIEGNTFIGDPDPFGSGTCSEQNNVSGVRTEGAILPIIRNNTIRNYGGGIAAPDPNHSGITLYRWQGATIENNHIENCGSGIYLKQINTGTLTINVNTIRLNKFVNVRDGIKMHRTAGTSSFYTLLSQNIFYNATGLDGDGESCVHILGINDNTTPTHLKAFNNLCDGFGQRGLFVDYPGTDMPANSAHIWWNNIITDTGGYAVNFNDNVIRLIDSNLDIEHNLYFGFSTFSIVDASNTSFAAWQALGRDNDSPASLSTSDPLFVDSANRDYHLRISSPARTLGRVHATYSVGGSPGATIPAGPYITGDETIGPATTASVVLGRTRLRIRGDH